jgi:hypothetical protein
MKGGEGKREGGRRREEGGEEPPRKGEGLTLYRCADGT